MAAAAAAAVRGGHGRVFARRRRNAIVFGYASVSSYNASFAKADEVVEYASLLRGCRAISAGKRVHSRLVEDGYGQDRFLGNLLVQMYGNCGSLEDALRVFGKLRRPNVFSWNIMLAAYAQNGHLRDARSMLGKMPQWSLVSWNAMVGAYAQRGYVEEARSLFDQMPVLDVFSWTSMITAYAHEGLLQDARCMFESMPERNAVSWTAMIAAFAQNGKNEAARELFQKMPQTDAVSWNCMIKGYAGNTQLQARMMFDRMSYRNVVSWTVMIDAYARDGHMDEARSMFTKMPQHNLVSCTAMFTAQAQSGNLQEASNMFDKMSQRDVVSWTAMIAAYAQNGQGRTALDLFRMMILEGIQPNDITFMSIFCVCSHVGLLSDGRDYFVSMQGDHGISPTADHYECVIDLFGRTGRLDRAEELIKSMPFQPDALTWMTLLGACKVHVDVQRAARIVNEVLELDPENAAPYVLLSNIYGAAGKWTEVSKVRKLMNDRGVKNVPGQSWIEVNGNVHVFTAGDSFHAQREEIYAELHRLSSEMKAAGYVADTKAVLHCVVEGEKANMLSFHSEKLAIAFGLINTLSGTPLHIVKNLRVCSDCHSATKLISKIVGRRIVVRDARRFHHFEDGSCSCGDFW